MNTPIITFRCNDKRKTRMLERAEKEGKTLTQWLLDTIDFVLDIDEFMEENKI